MSNLKTFFLNLDGEDYAFVPHSPERENLSLECIDTYSFLKYKTVKRCEDKIKDKIGVAGTIIVKKNGIIEIAGLKFIAYREARGT